MQSVAIVSNHMSKNRMFYAVVSNKLIGTCLFVTLEVWTFVLQRVENITIQKDGKRIVLILVS